MYDPATAHRPARGVMARGAAVRRGRAGAGLHGQRCRARWCSATMRAAKRRSSCWRRWPDPAAAAPQRNGAAAAGRGAAVRRDPRRGVAPCPARVAAGGGDRRRVGFNLRHGVAQGRQGPDAADARDRAALRREGRIAVQQNIDWRRPACWDVHPVRQRPAARAGTPTTLAKARWRAPTGASRLTRRRRLRRQGDGAFGLTLRRNRGPPTPRLGALVRRRVARG